jgi:hypothetical protein
LASKHHSPKKATRPDSLGEITYFRKPGAERMQGKFETFYDANRYKKCSQKDEDYV